ncbi:hypothetical protein D3C79_852200 [compost metagenome]
MSGLRQFGGERIGRHPVRAVMATEDNQDPLSDRAIGADVEVFSVPVILDGWKSIGTCAVSVLGVFLFEYIRPSVKFRNLLEACLAPATLRLGVAPLHVENDSEQRA